jgi:hypothetical protein
MSTYSYTEKIKSPQNMNMGGSAKNVDANIKGLQGYIDLLVNGKSKASKYNVLGDRYFLNTNTKCPNNNENRYVIINNKPLGTSMGGVNKNLRGIIPGMIEKMQDLDPFTIIKSLNQTEEDMKCEKVKILTVDNDHNTNEEEQYVSRGDIKRLHPCVFKLKNNKNGVNPVTKEKVNCESEGFSNISNMIHDYDCSKLPRNKLIKIYNILISIFGVYIIYLLINNRKINKF